MLTPQVIYKQPKAKIPKSRMLTYEDYARLTPPDSGNYELQNGRIIFIQTPYPKQQLFSINLQSALHIFVRENSLGQIFAAPLDTYFTEHDTLQPDILFLSNDRLNLIGNKKIEGAPDLVVEILSPSNNPKEMGYKKLVYEFSGVREYWIVNLDKKILTQYENVNGEFFQRRIFQATDTLTSIILEGFETSMSDLFE
jgi:Uma2 family endonuclease